MINAIHWGHQRALSKLGRQAREQAKGANDLGREQTDTSARSSDSTDASADGSSDASSGRGPVLTVHSARSCKDVISNLSWIGDRM